MPQGLPPIASSRLLGLFPRLVSLRGCFSFLPGIHRHRTLQERTSHVFSHHRKRSRRNRWSRRCRTSQRVTFERWNNWRYNPRCKMQTLLRRGVPYYEYHSFRKALVKHENNWCSDWDTLRSAAKENFPGPAILARVPAEKALECENRRHGPLVAVGVCGDVVLCLENG